jgi:hypothetical protein
MEIKKTERGFAIVEFIDRYDKKCSLQKSSIAFEECIWLGLTDANPIVMASDAVKVGIKTKETTGWISYPIPEQVQISTRMHLTQEQVAELIPHLQKFVDTGEI